MALEYKDNDVYEDGCPLEPPKICRSLSAGCVRINLTTAHMYLTLKRIIDEYEKGHDIYEPNDLADEMHTLADDAITHIDKYGKE